MANATSNLRPTPAGQEGYFVHLPVAAATHIYDGTMIAQNASGYAVPYSTASSSMAVGVSQHEQDNTIGTAANGTLRIKVEFGRPFLFPNGAGGDAFADTDVIGSIVFGTDDHTAAKTSGSQLRQPIGFFHGLDPDTGKVRVLVDPARARLVAALIVPLTDSSTGAVSNTLHDGTGAYSQSITNNNIASLGAKINAILAIIGP